MSSSTSASCATYDATTPAVVVTNFTLTHPAVTSEALRWSTGTRGPAVAAAAMHGGDLTAYVEQAVAVGAQAIAVAGGTQDTFNLEQLVQDVGARTLESTSKASQVTAEVVTDASKAMKVASTEANKALTEASELARKTFGDSVTEAQKDLHAKLSQLLGGDDAELIVRLQPVLEQFGTKLSRRADEHTTQLFDKATRAPNPDDPASPLAKHQAQLAGQHEDLTKRVERQHEQLVAKVDELATAVRVQQAAAKATALTANVTPLKGTTYEAGINALMSDIAVGLGDEYVDTSSTTGQIARCQKGDGLLIVEAGRARVLLEMHDSQKPRPWNDYLDEAERNRQATASLGLVPTVGQNGGQAIRVLGTRRIVMAFDPGDDDPTLLRTVVILLRTAAMAALARQDDSGVVTATERIAQALEVLPKLDAICKAAGYIRKSADKIDTEGEAMQTSLSRLLLQAQTALSGANLAAVDSPSSSDSGAA